MESISKRVQQISESETLAMAQLTREYQQQGIDVIGLSLGEPDFNTPAFIKEAAKKAIDDNFSKYTAVPGTLELRKAVVEKLKRDNNLAYTPDQIVVSTGAKQSLYNICQSLLNPGDEVIIPAPYWVTYKEVVKLTGAIPVVIHTQFSNKYKATAAEIQAKITPKTKMLLYSSPSNPTGSVYSEQELSEIAALIQQHPSIYVVSDEIYEHINFIGKHVSMAQFPDIKDRVIIVNGVSKAFAMTGWRLGWMAAAKPIADACTKMQGQVTSGTCSITQKAAEAALLTDPVVLDEMKRAFQKRRDLIYQLFTHIKGLKAYVPDGAFYLFVDVSHYFGFKDSDGNLLKSSSDVSMYLIHKAHVSVVPGEAFEEPNCIRISYAASESKITEAARRIQRALASLS